MAKSNLAKIIPLRPEMDGGSISSEAVVRTSKEVAEKAKESDDKILKSNEKLSSNLERLAKAIQEGAIQPNAAPNYKEGGTWDQRTVKDQAKDYLMGRKGADGKRDPFDKDSLKYKFGSVRGLAKTLNVVEDNSFVGNLLGRREDKLKRADTLMKMNPQMKNLKQFGGDDEKVRQYYIKQHEEKFAPAQAKAQSEKYKLDSMLQSGISPEELGKSIGGKRQIKAVQAAQADALLNDKFRKQEVKSTLDGMAGAVSPSASMPSNVIPFPSGSSGGFGSDKESTLENNRLMAQQNDMLSGMRENTATFPIYLEEWREEKERQIKYDAELLQAVKEGGSGGGGGLMDMAGSALDALGGKGKGVMGKAGKMLSGAGGMLKGALPMLGKVAAPLAAGAAIVEGGMTAYQGYNAASEKEARGEITKQEATVEKGGAIGEGTGNAVGGAVGALKGAAVGAAVGSVVPVVGTAIGGLVGAAIGGIGGSYLGGKAGKFLGETGGKIKNWFSSSNPDKSGAEAKVTAMTATPQAQTDPKVTHATAASKKIEEAKARLEQKNADGSQGTAVQQEALKQYDKVYQEARSDGKSVKEAKGMAQKARVDYEKNTKEHLIAGEPYIEGQPLSRAQMVAVQYGKGSGNSYPPAVEAQYAKQKASQTEPPKVSTAPRPVAERVASDSTEVAAAKESAPAASVNTVTNNATKVENRNTQAIKPPIRNQDSSYYKMVEARYVY